MTKSLQHRKVRWGIIGLGKIAQKFSADLITINDAELYAVASRTQEKANTFAIKYNVEKAYGSYKALVNDTQVDAVYIATPHSFHKENTILCLQHGIAVLCEKPLAMNTEEVMTMVAKSKENNVLLMEALWTYFLPHYQYVLEILNKREYGGILKLEADFGFIPKFDLSSRVINKSLGGGSLLDIGIYPIFAALSTLGSPKSIDANATFFENGVDSSCTMVFNYNNGVKAFLKSTFLEQTQTQAIIYCEKGTIKINSRFHHPSSVTVLLDGKENTINFENKSIGYVHEIMHFNQLLRDGKTESDIMTFDFSIKLMQILDKIREIIDLKY